MMMKRRSIRKIHYLIFVILLISPSATHGSGPDKLPVFFQPLIDRLSQEGFDFEFLSKLFSDPRVEFLPAVTTLSLFPNEIPERYARFLTPEAILLSKQFLNHNLKTLRELERRFHVDKEVAVAILLVESRFGENIGKYRVVPTLASIALIDSPENLNRNCEAFRQIDPGLSCDWIESRSRRKAEWAYQELKCFLNIIRQEKIDPLEVFGSHAGAMGMAQFIPSSYLNYALSREGFERWLLSREEAIFSIGNYLRSHGWKRNLPIQKKKEILFYYNRSVPYVETVLKISQKLKH
ncbi:MAG: lytic murein transglycosylase [Thermodesulfobacteriota bacterium]